MVDRAPPRASASGLALALPLALVGFLLAGCSMLPGFGPTPVPEWETFGPIPTGEAEGTSPTPKPTPTPDPNQPVSITISAVVPIGEDGATCPAKVTLSFVPYNKTEIGRHAALWATCTDRAFRAIDASGDYDGHSFDLHEGRWAYEGSFDGTDATISGGPKGATFVFPVEP